MQKRVYRIQTTTKMSGHVENFEEEGASPGKFQGSPVKKSPAQLAAESRLLTREKVLGYA